MFLDVFFFILLGSVKRKEVDYIARVSSEIGGVVSPGDQGCGHRCHLCLLWEIPCLPPPFLMIGGFLYTAGFCILLFKKAVGVCAGWGGTPLSG